MIRSCVFLVPPTAAMAVLKEVVDLSLLIRIKRRIEACKSFADIFHGRQGRFCHSFNHRKLSGAAALAVSDTFVVHAL